MVRMLLGTLDPSQEKKSHGNLVPLSLHLHIHNLNRHIQVFFKHIVAYTVQIIWQTIFSSLKCIRECLGGTVG